MPTPRRMRIEGPTILLAVLIYGAWGLVTWWHAVLPTWLLACAGGWLVAWHGSLQHETIHGHPTGYRAIDGAIGGVPLALWLPYGVYRRTHIAHHLTAAVTDPFADPESRYLSGTRGIVGRLNHLVEYTQSTLAARLLLGPALTIGRFLVQEAVRAIQRPRAALRDWLPHLVGVAAIVAWLSVCRMSIAEYALLFVYPGTALSLLRSFAEHRASDDPGHRVAIVERAGPFGLLFLNNNLHAAHHRAPGLAWYRLPAFHREHRDELLAANGGLLYRGYQDVARRYAVRAHDGLVHPDHR